MAFSSHKDPEQIKEIEEDETSLDVKVAKLAQMIRDSKHFVAFTGAGISTSTGISDFRGPQGVWTLRAQGKVPSRGADTLKVFPSAAHMSLVELQRRGLLKFVISQNTDGLHRRSGLPPDCIAELHGNSNLEVCKACKAQYFRDFQCRQPGLHVKDHRTRRFCRCGHGLDDSIINFGENLPEDALTSGWHHSRVADVCLVLGSSLTVTPAADMPAKVAEKGGMLVICNLQKTPLDSEAKLRIFAKTDILMEKLMKELNLPIPQWKLCRYIQISRQMTNSVQLEGIDNDGKTSTILTHVTFNGKKIEETKKVIKSSTVDTGMFKLEPHKSGECLMVNLHFFGHYGEPDFELKIGNFSKKAC